MAVMARPLRVAVAGGWYQVTARGNERRAIFQSPHPVVTAILAQG